MKWLSGWDATWWCTACWCRNVWKINGPLDETKHKDPIRLRLKIVTTRMVDDLHYGSQRYCAQPRPGHRCDRCAEAQSDDRRHAASDAKWRGQLGWLTHGPTGRPAASGTGAEAASRAPRARDQGRACARRASSHKSSPRARILSPEYVCVDRSVQIVTVVTKEERRAWLRARASV